MQKHYICFNGIRRPKICFYYFNIMLLPFAKKKSDLKTMLLIIINQHVINRKDIFFVKFEEHA